MTVKHLVTSGDSFNDNCGKRWSHFLSEATGIQLHNRGQGSSGNDWISKTVIYQVHQLLKVGIPPEEILVIPMWTNPVRKGLFVSKDETLIFDDLFSCGNRVNFIDNEANKFLDSDPIDGYILGSMSCVFNESINTFKREAITGYFPREALAIESYEHFLRVQWLCQSMKIALTNLCWMDIMHYPWYKYEFYGEEQTEYKLTKDLYRNVRPLYEMIDFSTWLFWKETGGLYEYVVDNKIGLSIDGLHTTAHGYQRFAEDFVMTRLKERNML